MNFANQNRAAVQSSTKPPGAYAIGFTPAPVLSAESVLQSFGISAYQWCTLDQVTRVRWLEMAVRNVGAGSNAPLDQALFSRLWTELTAFCQATVLATIPADVHTLDSLAYVQNKHTQFGFTNPIYFDVTNGVKASGDPGLSTYFDALIPTPTTCVRPLSTGFANDDARKQWDLAHPSCPAIMVPPPAPPSQSQPYIQPVPEVQWVAGVPNVVTGLTTAAVAYAIWKSFNPSAAAK